MTWSKCVIEALDDVKSTKLGFDDDVMKLIGASIKKTAGVTKHAKT